MTLSRFEPPGLTLEKATITMCGHRIWIQWMKSVPQSFGRVKAAEEMSVEIQLLGDDVLPELDHEKLIV